MSYEVAINKSWADILALNPQEKNQAIKFFSDEYSFNLEEKKIFSVSCNVPVKDFTSIILLHYLYRKIKGLPQLTGQWISFKELSGGESYYPAFRKRAIEPILNKYSKNVKGLLACLERLPSKQVNQADVAVVLQVAQGIDVLVEMWDADQEFGAEANILFDSNISKIFCTEDVAVLGGFIAKYV